MQPSRKERSRIKATKDDQQNSRYTVTKTLTKAGARAAAATAPKTTTLLDVTTAQQGPVFTDLSDNSDSDTDMVIHTASVPSRASSVRQSDSPKKPALDSAAKARYWAGKAELPQGTRANDSTEPGEIVTAGAASS